VTPIKVGFVLHVMNVAGAEVLVAETIRRLGARIAPVIFCVDEVGTLGMRMREEGVDVVPFHRRPGFDLSVSRRMASEIRTRALDVVHAHQYTPFFYSSIAVRLAALKGRPTIRPRVIFTEHGRHFPDVVSSKRRLINRVLFDRLADEVNAVCEFSARALRDKDGFVRRKVEVIPNGIDLPRYSGVDRAAARATLGLDPARRYVATVARFHPVKDHQTLLRGFAEVAVARTDVDLLLVGDGPLRAELERLVAELGVADRVRFMGVRDDVENILRASDVFALTSLSEAASITLLEAMASELPVVVTGVGGNPEIVRDGTDGLLVPRRSSGGVARAVLKILGDAKLGASMGRAAAERVRQRYMLDDTINRYFALYAGIEPAAGRTEAA
jgi:N-acetyl-alpha-D-glucosaminyl L-malate synthase BshA